MRFNSAFKGLNMHTENNVVAKGLGASFAYIQ